MKFIADAMLGRLAKWLRLLGFDVLYYPDIEDRAGHKNQPGTGAYYTYQRYPHVTVQGCQGMLFL